MISENYACAYKEVIEVLKYTKREDVNKIPKYKILLWKTNMKKDYDFKIAKTKSLDEQNLSNEAKAIIANIFKKYWATDYQREKIEAKEKYDMQQLEKEKFEKYNPDDIFKKKATTLVENNKIEENTQNMQMIEYKENIFKKIFNRVKNLFS